MTTFLNPVGVVERLDIWPGMKVADFGCGAGHFSIEIAKRIGHDGLVCALDVQKEVLEALKSRAKLEHLLNVSFGRVDLEADKGSLLADNLVDMVLISNILFQVEKKDAVAREAFRVLKTQGKLVVIEWESTESNLGPPKNLRLEKSAVRDIFLGVGFVFVNEVDTGGSHYGLIFKKP